MLLELRILPAAKLLDLRQASPLQEATFPPANSYTGGTTIANAAKLLVSHNTALGTGPVTIGTSGAAVSDTSSLQLTGGIALTGPTSISIFGSRTVPTSGGTAHIENVSGNNSYAGSIASLITAPNIVITSTAGKLTLSGPITFLSQSGSSGSQKSLNLAGAGDGEISGRITRSDGFSVTKPISIVKTGSGTWTLSNPDTSTHRNDYRGTTTVSAGSLLINTDNSLATGAITVSAGGTLGGNGINGGAATFSSGSFLSPGPAAGWQAT